MVNILPSVPGDDGTSGRDRCCAVSTERSPWEGPCEQRTAGAWGTHDQRHRGPWERAWSSWEVMGVGTEHVQSTGRGASLLRNQGVVCQPVPQPDIREASQHGAPSLKRSGDLWRRQQEVFMAS